MKKHLLGFLAVLALCVCLLPLEVSAAGASGECGDNLTWTLDENGTLTVSGSGVMNDYVYYPNPKVPWDDYKADIIHVVVGEHVTSIGKGAFLNCENLETVTLPVSLTTLGYGAFDNTGMPTVSFAGTAEQWAAIAAASSGVDGLTLSSFRFKGTDCVTGGMAGETVIWTLDEDGTLSFIGNGTLTGGAAARWYTDHVEDITAIVINDGITTLAYNAFSHDGGSNGYYDNLKSVIMADSVTYINDDVFEDCPALETVSLSANLTYLGSHAFEEAASLKSIVFPESSTDLTLGSGAFYNCAALQSVTMGKNVKVGFVSFSGCTALKDVYFRGTKAEWEAISFDSGNEALTNATIHYLQDTNYLAGGTCGDNLTWVVDSTDRLLFDGYGYMYDYTEETLPWSDYVSTIEAAYFPNNIRSIGDNAFYNHCALRTITIPSGVIRIGDNAFRGCTSLSGISIPDSVTIVGHSAFRSSGSSSLTITHLSKNLRTIEPYAFFLCKFTEETLNLSEVSTLDSYAFSSCEFRTILLGNWLNTIGTRAFYTASFQKVVIGTGVKQINGSAFAFCSVSDGIYFCGGEPNYPEATSTFVTTSGNYHRIYVAEGHAHTDAVYTTRVWSNADHATVKGQSFSATCEEAAYTKYSCAICGFVYKNYQGEAAGHSWSSWATTESTCLEDGLRTRTCTTCSEEDTEVLPATGHGYGNAVFLWSADFSTVTVSAVCHCGEEASQQCTVSWDNAVSGRLTATAEAHFGDALFTDSRAIITTVSQGTVTVTLPADLSGVAVIAAVYDDTGYMVDCTFEKVSGGAVTVSVAEGSVYLFFVDRTYRPIAPLMVLTM